MTLPTKIPRWATTGTIVEPTEGQKDTGWPTGYRVPSGWLNWLQNLNGLWSAHYRDSILTRWQLIPVNQTGWFKGLCFVSEINGDLNQWFVAGDASYGIFKGRGGYAFSSQSTPAIGGQEVRDIIYDAGNDQIIAVGVQDFPDPLILTSPDGVNYTQRNSNLQEHLNGIDVKPDGSMLVAAGDDAVYTRSTNAGVSWTNGSIAGKVQDLNDVVWSESLGLWIMGGEKGSDADALLLTSSDGSSWTERASQTDGEIFRLHVLNGYVVGVGQAASSGVAPPLIYSADGINWTLRALPSEYWAANARIDDAVYIADWGLWAFIYSKSVAGDGAYLLVTDDIVAGDFVPLALPLPDAHYMRRLVCGDNRLMISIGTNVGGYEGRVLVSEQW